MNLSRNGQTLADYVVKSFENTSTPTEAQLRERMQTFKPVMSALGVATSEEDDESVLKELMARLRVSMDIGVGLKSEEAIPWLDSRRASIDPYYWMRFRDYLQKDWSPGVLRSFDRATDSILDLCGNPAADEDQWSRRGLVIGDVQSGKTATYTALCCKAADAGYQVIVLLAGSLESLRRQTQKRLDEGFAGLDSSEFLPSKGALPKNRAVGAGLANQKRFAAVFTSRTRDFNKDVLNSRQLTLSAVKEPVLFVVKKHKAIIENLATWLSAYNADSGGRIRESLLVIDDEADNASVNTNDENKDPTAINKSIRHLLSLFTRNTYVGFTATPFANVFIDPDTTDQDFFKEELFPKDFIYALDSPTNYIGAGTLFGLDQDSEVGEAHGAICKLDDAAEVFPLKHKSSLKVAKLPETLLNALRLFLLANAVRDLRGDLTGHRSMLINVSRFTDVQDLIRDHVDEAVEEMKLQIKSYGRSADGERQSEQLREMHDLFDEEYSGCGFSWDDVRAQLYAATAPVIVRSVNQRAGAASLDYPKYEKTGLRVVAVGGNSLSRGLTLEGLCISYFHRNAQAYDTLLQMGRWFGYRPGYEDLCRLWITTDAQQWYAKIAQAAEDLKDQVRVMRRQGLTPRDFGLKVRSHPDSLIVTARNKMRKSKTIVKQISWNAEGAETTKLRAKAAEANLAAVASLFRDLEKDGINISESNWKNPIAYGVDKEVVARFLDTFDVHPHNFKLYVAADERDQFGIRKFIAETQEPSLQKWDIAFPQGSEAERQVFGGRLSIQPIRRVVGMADKDQTILVSGAKARVGSRGSEREGVEPEVIRNLNKAAADEGRTLSDKEIRNVREKPLLLVYCVVPYDEYGKSLAARFPERILVAYGLSFPKFDDNTLRKTVSYRVNTTWLRDHAIDDDDEGPDGDDGDD